MRIFLVLFLLCVGCDEGNHITDIIHRCEKAGGNWEHPHVTVYEGKCVFYLNIKGWGDR